MPPSANRQIARAAGTVMAAMVLSQLIGLVANALTGAAFGTGAESEAFFAANRFSEILFNLVAGGALSSAFIPTFSTLLAQNQRASAWKLLSSITNLVTLIISLVALLAAVFAPQVVRYILAPGFAASDPAKEALTVDLLRLQLPSTVIFGLSGLAMGTLNAHQRFLYPALAPSMYKLGWIGGIWLLSPWLGVHGLGWGVLIGAALHLALQIPALLRLPERRYTLTLGLDNPDVREVARLMGPRLLGVAVVQLNFLLNTFLASSQPEGSLAGISLAFPLMLMPQAAIAQSAAIAALPTFSAQAALGKLDEMRASLAATLRGVLLLAIPATVGLILLRKPIVALIYQHGVFTSVSTELVAWALLWYALGLVWHSVLEVISRAFYALHDTKTPVMVGVAAMTLNLLFSLLFSSLFQQMGWAPHGGLALANSLATLLETCTLLYLMRRRLNGLQGRRILGAVLHGSLAALVMGLVLAGWLSASTLMSDTWVGLVGVLVGAAAYLVMLVLMRVSELQLAWSVVRSRLLRKG